MNKNPRQARLQRHARVRTKVSGTEARPRLAVFRSLNHIYVQVIDDLLRRTVVSTSTLESSIKEQLDGKSKTEQSRVVGTMIAEMALSKGIKEVVFDRGGFKYHGRVKALADAAREAGLKF